jgi:hypothetical protein
MKKALTLRCSALPLAFLCAGSVRGGEIAINPDNALARLGTAVHECLRPLPRAGAADWEGLPDIAQRLDVEADDLRALVGLAQKMWKGGLYKAFPAARTEVPLGVTLPDGTTLTGHTDILARSLDTGHVGDWKSGRLDADAREQLLGYCALAMLDDPSLDAATAGVIWIRDNEFEHYSLSRAELPAYLRRLQVEVIDWDGTYRPGGHCRYCPRSHECPARHAMVRRDVAAFLGGELTSYAVNTNALETLPPEQLHALLASADLVHELSAHLRDAMRELVERNGDIVAGGKRLTIEQTTKRHLNVEQTFPVLTAHGFEDTDFAKVVHISAAKAEKVVAQRAGHGKGAAASRELRAALEEAGAVETTTVKRLVTKRA